MAERGTIKVGILTVSDSCSSGTAVDKSGENLKTLIENEKFFKGSVVAKDIIPDEIEDIKAKLLHWTDRLKLDLILTTGGTGFAPRDVTPEATKAVLEKEATGMTMAMIKGSLDITPKAMLSRLVCGSRGGTLIVNLPGSTKGAAECLEIASAGIPHAVDLLNDRLSEVEKTHRQMIKQHELTSFEDKTLKCAASLNEEEYKKIADHATQNSESQDDRVEESGYLSQAYSMFKLIELLIRLAMPSIHHSSAAYRILQSLSSSLSAIKNVASIRNTFEVWISALKSVIEATGNESDIPTDHISNSRLLKVAAYLDKGSVKDQTGINSSISLSVPSLNDAHTMNKLTQGTVRETYCTIGYGHVSSKEDELSFQTSHALNHYSSTRDCHSEKTGRHCPTASHLPCVKEISKRMQTEALISQSAPENFPPNFADCKINSCINTTAPVVHCQSPSFVIEHPEKTSQPSCDVSPSYSESNGDQKAFDVIERLKDNLTSIITSSCNSEDCLPKYLSSETNKMCVIEKSSSLSHYKKLIMDCDRKQQELEKDNFDFHVSQREASQQNICQNYLTSVISSAPDASFNKGHPHPQYQTQRNALVSHHQEYEIPNLIHQQTTNPKLSQVTNDLDLDRSDFQDKNMKLVQRYSDKSSGLCSKEVTSTHHVSCQENTSPSRNGDEIPYTISAIRSPVLFHSISKDFKRTNYGRRNPVIGSVKQPEGHGTTETVNGNEQGHKRSSPFIDSEQSSQISSSNVNMALHSTCSTFKSAKIHNIRSRTHGELVYVPVGKAFTEFISEHESLKGINLYKGKRDIKKLLVRLCRQEDTSSKATSWKRGKEVLERNRLDDYFQLTPEGAREQAEVHGGKKRDQYVVNWYMWCPGHGNCQRKCGGFGQCLESKVNVEAVALRPRESQHPIISVDQALSTVLENTPVLATEKRSAFDALGHCLATDVYAADPLPPFRASIKDGYAIRAADGAGIFKVEGDSAMGDMPEKPLAPGTCIRISTGAAVPEGADAVVQVEDTELVEASKDSKEELKIKILKAAKVGQDIRQVGSDIAKGQQVLCVGQRLGPAQLGLLATVGVTKVEVYRKPLVGVMSTGNELLQPGEPLTKGMIRDCNRTSLLALLKDVGTPAVDLGVARDTPDDVLHSFRQAMEKVDIIVTSGGVSMGHRDCIKQVLEVDLNAKLHFARVFMKPGKPTTFATTQHNGKGKLFFSLPGNPVSALVTCNLYLVPAVRKMMGCPDPHRTVMKVKTDRDLNLDPRPEYHRAYLSWSEDDVLPTAISTGNQISSRLLSVNTANVLLKFPPRSESQTSLKKGTVVDAIVIGQL